MPKFRVTKKNDAYVLYNTVVEADDEQQACDRASAWDYDGKWFATGQVDEFDHTDIFVEDVEAAPGDESLEDMLTLVVNAAERDMILAALRLWTDVVNDGGGEYLNEMLVEIATNSDAHEMLDNFAIDELCERINT